MTNTESPVALAARGLRIGRREGHLTPEDTDATLAALAGDTPDADTEELGLLLACMDKMSTSFEAEKPAQDAAALLRSRLANNGQGTLAELVGDQYAQALVRAEPLSEWLGMMYPGINALYNDAVEAFLDIDDDHLGDTLRGLTEQVRPFTADGRAAALMLSSVVQFATEVSPFTRKDLRTYTRWAATVGPTPTPVELEPANEDWTFPTEASWLLAIAREHDLTLDEALIGLAKVVNVTWTFV